MVWFFFSLLFFVHLLYIFTSPCNFVWLVVCFNIIRALLGCLHTVQYQLQSIPWFACYYLIWFFFAVSFENAYTPRPKLQNEANKVETSTNISNTEKSTQRRTKQIPNQNVQKSWSSRTKTDTPIRRTKKKVEQKKLKHTQHGIGICRWFGCSQCACNTHRMNVTVL